MNGFIYMPEDNGNNYSGKIDPYYRFPSSPQQQPLFPLATPPTSDDESVAMMMNPLSSSLSDIIACYRSQPDLLRLILLSKVEEDKRRTEEAKLRQKEFDMLLQQQQQEFDRMVVDDDQPHFLLPHTYLSSDGEEYDALTIGDHRRDLRTPPLTMEAPNTATATVSFSPTSTASSPISLFHMGVPTTSSTASGLAPPSSPFCLSQPEHVLSTAAMERVTPTSIMLEHECYPPLEKQHQTHHVHNNTLPRRRRKMQAITKIVNTREYPYIDGYFWKNNGNTIQKEKGNKSIYYKCTNSSKGCLINRTITWKKDGEYLVKYRGEHLLECGKVERIVEV